MDTAGACLSEVSKIPASVVGKSSTTCMPSDAGYWAKSLATPDVVKSAQNLMGVAASKLGWMVDVADSVPPCPHHMSGLHPAPHAGTTASRVLSADKA